MFVNCRRNTTGMFRYRMAVFSMTWHILHRRWMILIGCTSFGGLMIPVVMLVAGLALISRVGLNSCMVRICHSWSLTIWGISLYLVAKISSRQPQYVNAEVATDWYGTRQWLRGWWMDHSICGTLFWDCRAMLLTQKLVWPEYWKLVPQKGKNVAETEKWWCWALGARVLGYWVLLFLGAGCWDSDSGKDCGLEDTHHHMEWWELCQELLPAVLCAGKDQIATLRQNWF